MPKRTISEWVIFIFIEVLLLVILGGFLGAIWTHHQHHNELSYHLVWSSATAIGYLLVNVLVAGSFMDVL